MDDVWAEQMAFEAELAAVQGGHQALEGHAEEDWAAGRGHKDEDDEDMWRDLAAFEAEMEQLHGEAPQPGGGTGGTSAARSGLNPNAVSFNAAGSTREANPAAPHASDDAGTDWSGEATEHSSGGRGLIEGLHGLRMAPGESNDGPAAGLCPQHRAAGDCSRGDSCPYVHGDLCEVPYAPSLPSASLHTQQPTACFFSCTTAVKLRKRKLMI